MNDRLNEIIELRKKEQKELKQLLNSYMGGAMNLIKGEGYDYIRSLDIATVRAKLNIILVELNDLCYIRDGK